MARIKSCIKMMRKAAKSGTTSVRYSLFGEEIRKLEEEGFVISLPKGYSMAKTKKHAVEVRISWKNPTNRDGIAQDLKKLVAKYCRSQNAAKRVRKIQEDKRDVRCAKCAYLTEVEKLIEELQEEDVRVDVDA